MRRNYIVNAAYYTAMPFIRNGLAFITLPILTSFLTPADYGMVGLITIVSSFGVFGFCGVGNACYRYYFKYKDSPDPLNLFFSTTLIFVLLSGAVYLLLLFLAYPYLNGLLFKNRLDFIWLLLGFLQVTFNYLGMTNQYVFQNRHEGRRWFLNEGLFTGIYVLLSLVLVLVTPLRFEALIVAGLAAEVVKTLVSFVPLRGLYSARFSRAMLREALAYSWPQVPAGIIGFGYTYLDRIIMSRVQGLTQVGVLDMSARLASTVKMATDGVNGVFSPKTLELLKEGTEEAGRTLAEIGLKVLTVVLSVSLLVMLFSKELVILLLKGNFRAVIYVVPLYIYAQIFGALGMLAYWLIYYHKEKTWLQMPILLTGLVAGTVSNLLLIPRYGLMGAAAAMFLTSGIVQTTQFYIGLKCTPVPFNLGKIKALFGALIAETALLYFLYSLDLFWPVEIGIKILMLAAFVGLCFTLKTLTLCDVTDSAGLLVDKVKGMRLFRPRSG